MTEELINPADADAVMPEGGFSADPESAAPEGPAVQALHLGPLAPGASRVERGSLDLILDVDLEATVELGRAKLSIRDILGLGPGSVVELDKLAGEPADLLINGRRLARGEVVVIDDDFGLRITEILTPTERLNSLR
jgi:flagellar motor switch protein FliN/FliY